jgi:ribonucleoside-diphosphate reductase alpha chain
MTLNLARDSVSTNRPPTTTPSPDQAAFRLTAPQAGRTQMTVTKRSGERELVDVNKIVRAVTRCC